MEQLVILLLIALISIINWIVQKSRETREKRKLEKRADQTGEKPEQAPVEPVSETQTETAMRRLREALGLPEEAEPPLIPKRVEHQIPQPPPERPAPPPLPKPAARRPAFHVPSARPHLEHRKFELPHRMARPPEKEILPRPPSRIRELLSSSGGLRDAIVLSEILGPPKSLREERS